MLSDVLPEDRPLGLAACLNAPFGAQCFPTNFTLNYPEAPYDVSMHLLVLSAFRQARGEEATHVLLVSMHLLVLSAFRRPARRSTARPCRLSQCTFWCSVLSDEFHTELPGGPVRCLNAPFGAQCFPTSKRGGSNARLACLNAPFGAQCFPTIEQEAPYEPAVWSQCTFWCSVLSDAKSNVGGSAR